MMGRIMSTGGGVGWGEGEINLEQRTVQMYNSNTVASVSTFKIPATS